MVFRRLPTVIIYCCFSVLLFNLRKQSRFFCNTGNQSVKVLNLFRKYYILQKLTKPDLWSQIPALQPWVPSKCFFHTEFIKNKASECKVAQPLCRLLFVGAVCRPLVLPYDRKYTILLTNPWEVSEGVERK